MSDRVIRLYYSTIDGFRESRTFKTLKGARAYARRRIGTSFDLGSTYAVDMFGTGKLEASGVALAELFEVSDSRD